MVPDVKDTCIFMGLTECIDKEGSSVGLTSSNPGSCSGAPLVTVVCHAYNHASYIAETLDSILSQRTTFEFEILVHDDASIDGTREIVQRYLSRYPGRIRAIMQSENQYSKGIRPSFYTFRDIKGKYFAFCEGDDCWTSRNKLHAQVSCLEEMPGVDFCFHPAIRLDVSSGRKKKFCDYGGHQRLFTVEDVLKKRAQFAPSSSYLIRASSLSRYPKFFFDSPSLPYGDFFIECFSGANGLIYLPEFMSIYRRNVPGSHTSRMKVREASDLLENMEVSLGFVERMSDYIPVSKASIRTRMELVRMDYGIRFFVGKNYHAYRDAVSGVKIHGWRQLVFMFVSASPLIFHVARLLFGAFASIKSGFHRSGDPR